MKKLVINRKEWLPHEIVSEYKKDSCLYSSSLERYCCLGLVCRDLANIPKRNMEYAVMPASLSLKEMNKLIKLELVVKDNKLHDGGFYNTDTAKQLAMVNDARDITLDQREKEIIVLFSTIDIECEFVGELE